MDHQLQSMELARVGRLALMGELAASLAHEVNNPLGAMVANASAGQRLLARGELAPDELRELLADIVADGHRARDVIQSVRTMVRKSESSHSLIAMKEVIQDLLRMTRADALARKVSVVAEVDPNVGEVMGNRVQLLQVLLNLTMNAFEALGVVRADSRRVVIRAARVEDGTSPGERARYRSRISGRDRRSVIRAILLHQDRRNRHGPRDRAQHYRSARRHPLRRKLPGGRGALHRFPAPSARGEIAGRGIGGICRSHLKRFIPVKASAAADLPNGTKVPYPAPKEAAKLARFVLFSPRHHAACS